MGRDVVSRVESALVVVGETKVKDIIADALAVDVELVVTDAGDVGAGIARDSVNGKKTLENAATGDPMSLPRGA